MHVEQMNEYVTIKKRAAWVKTDIEVLKVCILGSPSSQEITFKHDP